MEAKEEAIEARAETTRPKIEKWKTLGQSEYNVFKTGYTNYMLGKKEDQRPYAFLTEEVKADLKVLALGRTMKPEFFQEETWEALNGNTFWELCDTLFPGKPALSSI